MEEQTSTDTNSETMERYFDSLLASHTALSEALEGARKRGVSASEKLSEALFERQREALELTKKLAMSPQAVSDNTKAVLQAATEAQSRALDFAKELYSSQTEMGDEFRASFKAVANSSKEATKAAGELVRAWGAENPMSAALKKGFETLRGE